MADERDNNRQTQSPGQWDRYWAHGFLTSCADAFTRNYEGTIASAWRQFFADLPAGARLLDICTGNGAIAALAADWSIANDSALSIDAIDLAKIRPDAALKDRPEIASRIRFHPCTPADKTPFDARAFDAITGQFALEYTPLEETITELARVAAPGCRAMFITHHSGSVVLETAHEELANGQLLLAETRLFDHARDFIGYVGSTATGEGRQLLSQDPRAEARRMALNRAAAQVADRIAGSPHPELLTNALGCVGEAYKLLDTWGIDRALERLGRGHREIVLNLERLEDLQHAAIAASDRDALTGQFRAAGFFTPRFDVLLHDDGRILGWQLRTVRRA